MGFPLRRVERGIAGGDAFHAGNVLVAICAGFLRCTSLGVPQHLAVEHPQGRGVRRIVILHCARFAAHAVVSGLPFVGGNVICAGAGNRRERADAKGQRGDAAERHHSTVIVAVSVTAYPLSPIHSNVRVPLSVAVVKNVR